MAPTTLANVVIVLGVIVAIVTVLLAVGAITGRVTATSCCGIADPRHDIRMREAFVEVEEPSVMADELNFVASNLDAGLA